MFKVIRKIDVVKNLREHFLTLTLCFLCLLFLVGLFKNISYPLLWADESMTAVEGTRVLEYGYPKVHDGKNVVYDLRHSNPKLGIDEKTDAYIGGANWGMYYVAAIAVKVAQLSDNIYTKTAILRIPFALAGLVGLLIFGFLGAQFFESRVGKKGFWALFGFFELISIPLVLHLREVRYYSLAVFLVALVTFIYVRYRILNKTKYLTYTLFVTLSLFLLFVTFSPVYFIFLISIFLYESIVSAKIVFSQYLEKSCESAPESYLFPKIAFYDYVRSLLPIILSLIAVSPLIFFFKTFYIAGEMAKFNFLLFGISKLDMYLANLSVIWKYFRSFDFIYLAIFLKLCLLFCFLKSGIRGISFLGKRRLMLSNFLAISFVIYFFAIAQIPNFPFTRYLIPLQPVLAGFISVNISKNMEYLEGHAYELFHQYKGPLDYMIPFKFLAQIQASISNVEHGG